MTDERAQATTELSRPPVETPRREDAVGGPPLGRRVFRLQQRRLFPPGAWRPVLGVSTALGARSGRESIVVFGFLLYIFGRRNGNRLAEERSGA